MDTSEQTAQPVPLFYGTVDTGAGVTQDLTAGFDYVITKVVVQPVDAGAAFLSVRDESGVTILATGVPTDDYPSEGQGVLTGEIPIGPRTALELQVDGVACSVYIGGYALTPPTTLSV